jgi:hypothetical protein
MTEPMTPTALTLSGIAAAVFGFLFDVPGSTVFAAAAGAFLAVRLGDPVGFLKSFGMVAGGTFAGACGTSLFISWAGDYPQRGVAFVMTLFLVYFRKELLESARAMIKGESLRELIRGFKKP